MINKLVANTAKIVVEEVEKIIVGKSEQIRLLFMAILAEGHILIEDIPGVGKTTLIKTIARVLGCDFKRIQFTPDLLPSDIVGITTYNQRTGEFQFMPGPVMTNILLADEINRAVPRTQAALLESMEEKQVTVDGKTSSLPSPFIVMATQNPIESEGTFMLPAAQMDRFIIKLSLGYPSRNEEGSMLLNLGDEIPMSSVNSILNPEAIANMQQKVREICICDSMRYYIVDLIQATRNHPMVKIGASPRASRALFKCAKVWAAMNSRDFVIPDDVQDIAPAILGHRLVLINEARLMKKSGDDILKDIISNLAAPPGKEEIIHVR